MYSGLEFVRVEPLRIAEQDLNASRMLSMMGADNLEVSASISTLILFLADAFFSDITPLHAYYSLYPERDGLR